jgi:putative membrane protein
MRVLWRIVANAVALWAATQLVSGIRFTGAWPTLFAVALVFGVLNATLRPILKLLTFPLLILTLGLFTFVLNAFMLWLTSKTAHLVGLEFHVDGFWAAFIGALVITVVSFALSLLVGRPQRHRRVARRYRD